MTEERFAAARFAAVFGALALLAACWFLTASMSADFYAPGGGAAWRNPSYGVLFLMWGAMMAAMMAPSAAPFLLLFWRFAARQKDETAAPAAAGGYFFAWGMFSAAAAAIQRGAADALDDSMALADSPARAALFAAAGIYQWTPLKFACLRGCRPPAVFLLLYWRRGAGGGFAAGTRYGAYCVGCCWALMLLLFAGGVMDLRWIAALAGYALAEKLLPHPRRTARICGAFLILLAALEFAGIRL